MTQKKSIRRALLGAALLLAAGTPLKAQAAVSQSGTSNLTVTLPDFIVLSYYNSVGLNFTTTTNATSPGTAGPSNIDVSWTDGTGKSLDVLTASLDSSKTSKAVTLKNAWAIAGLSNTGTAKVSISGTDLAKASTNSKIGASGSYKVAVGSGTPAASITTNLGLTSAAGDVSMTLDFSPTTQSGAHTGTFTITAETI